MAQKSYKNVEKITELLGDKNLGSLNKRLSSTEKSLAEILRKLTALEAEKAEREAAEEAARLEAQRAAEEAAKEAAKEAEKVSLPEEEPAEEAPVQPEEEKAEEVAAEEPVKEVKPAPRTLTVTPDAPRAPRYFRNGQVQGEYVAKPGAETTQTYRPRPQGERPVRPQGDRPARTDKPMTPRSPRIGTTPPVSAPVLPTKENKNFSQTAKKKTFERTYTEKKPVSKRTLIKQQGMTVEDFDEDKSGYRKMRTPKKQKRQEIQTVKIEHAVVTTQEIPLKVLSEKLGVSAV